MTIEKRFDMESKDMKNKYCVKTNEIAEIEFRCKKCNTIIEITKKENIISLWDYVLPRKNKCPNCGYRFR